MFCCYHNLLSSVCGSLSPPFSLPLLLYTSMPYSFALSFTCPLNQVHSLKISDETSCYQTSNAVHQLPSQVRLRVTMDVSPLCIMLSMYNYYISFILSRVPRKCPYSCCQGSHESACSTNDTVTHGPTKIYIFSSKALQSFIIFLLCTHNYYRDNEK